MNEDSGPDLRSWSDGELQDEAAAINSGGKTRLSRDDYRLVFEELHRRTNARDAEVMTGGAAS